MFAWDRLPEIATANGLVRPILDTATRTLDRLEAHVSTVEAGRASHAAHRHADEELVFVQHGTLEVTIGDTTHTAQAGSLVFFASGELHGMRNIGEGPATYLVVRWTSPGCAGPRPGEPA
ncbi:cupin domain-containing protein [Congregicoccus parvus]|uniref:cupin domain-containing protein n=1 Tax=Congregicoccus parvus TaxID=3081749 RepID=UPI003FA5CE47